MLVAVAWERGTAFCAPFCICSQKRFRLLGALPCLLVDALLLWAVLREFGLRGALRVLPLPRALAGGRAALAPRLVAVPRAFLMLVVELATGRLCALRRLVVAVRLLSLVLSLILMILSGSRPESLALVVVGAASVCVCAWMIIGCFSGPSRLMSWSLWTWDLLLMEVTGFGCALVVFRVCFVSPLADDLATLLGVSSSKIVETVHRHLR